MKKILIIFILIIYILMFSIFEIKSYAIEQTVSADINSIDSNQYPQIKEILQQLKAEHPNWNFKILYTDIDWNEAIANEYTGHGSSPKNLVQQGANYDGEWICPICGTTPYDNGTWYCASQSAIAYMMDPRNSANNSDIFQFMELTYTDYNIDTIRAMVSGTFLDNQSYISAIENASRNYNVNAYYLVARILQEQGSSGSTLSKGEGYQGQYVGYYNVFNIGASGNGTANVILNGLARAQREGWTSLEASIDGGTRIIAEQYIAKGQNTLYLQKFDVEATGGLYWHQYMQNILAAQSEGSKLRKTFETYNSLDGEYTFIIPLFKNMPATACPRPNTVQTTPSEPSYSELVTVNVTSTLRLRDAPNGSALSEVLYSGEIVTRLEKATTKVNGTYWDLVMKSNGTKGYAARETYDYESTYKLYLVPVEEETPVEPEQPSVPDTPEQPVTPENPDEIIKNDKVMVNDSNNQVTAIPETTIADLQELVGREVVVKNSAGEIIANDGRLGTGYVVDDKYTVVVIGDVNGDAEINSGDLFYTQLYLLKRITFNEYTQKASDVNKDAAINSGDLFYLQKYLLKKLSFSI